MRPTLILALALAFAACTPSPRVEYNPPEQDAYLAAVNQARSAQRTCKNTIPELGYPTGETSTGPSAPVRWNGLLGEAARQRADYVSRTGDVSHTEPGDPRPFLARAKNNGYNPTKISENIGQGQPDTAAVVQAWLASDNGHCNAVMDGAYVDLGMAKVGSSWVLLLAKP